MPVKADPRNRTAAGTSWLKRRKASVARSAERTAGPGYQPGIDNESNNEISSSFYQLPLSRVAGIYRRDRGRSFSFLSFFRLFPLFSPYVPDRYITAERTLLRNRKRLDDIALRSMCMNDRCSIEFSVGICNDDEKRFLKLF